MDVQDTSAETQPGIQCIIIIDLEIIVSRNFLELLTFKLSYSF